jgi:hypothetical protein
MHAYLVGVSPSTFCFHLTIISVTLFLVLTLAIVVRGKPAAIMPSIWPTTDTHLSGKL